MKEQELQKNKRLQQKLPCLMFGIILLQPILDILSFWQNELGFENELTLLLRFALLAAVPLMGFVLSDRKRFYLILGGGLLLFAGFHGAAILQVDALTQPGAGEVTGIPMLASDLINYARVIQLPLFTLAFITFLRRTGERGLSAMLKGMTAALLLIAAVVCISVVTDTNPYTYANKGLGLLGWFSATNAQSAVLSMLVPMVLMAEFRRSDTGMLRKMLMTILGIGLLFVFGTRLAYLAIVITTLALAFTIVVTDRRKMKLAVLCIASLAVCLGALPHSPMYENQQRVGVNAELKQQHIDRLVAEDEAFAAAHLEGEDLQRARLVGAYHCYVTGPVEKYGLARVAEAYDYSTDAGVVADNRLEKKTFCQFMMEDAPTLSHLFGLELGDMTFRGVNYDLENDFHGIYMLYGAVGLALICGFFLYFIGLILWALLKNAKRYYTLEAGACGAAFLMALAHAVATAGILRRPNASIYLSLVLAVIFYLVLVRKESKEPIS